MAMKEIALLIGSGVSIPCGMPSVSELTETVRCGDFWLDTDHRFRRGRPPFSYPSVADRSRKVRRLISLVAGSSSEAAANYEEIYYLCWQVHYHLLDQFPNSAIEPFVRWLREGLDMSRDELKVVSGDALGFIIDVVQDALFGGPTVCKELRWIADLCHKVNARIHIFSLNHDVLLENFLASHGIAYCDGFVSGLVRNHPQALLWRPEEFEANTQAKVFLYKLHGSVDWYRYIRRRLANEEMYCYVRLPGVNSLSLMTGQQWSLPCLQTKHGLLEPDQADDMRPVLCVGSYNKLFLYPREIFSQLWSLFVLNMQRCDYLVVCGYGFRDVGVNSAIAAWLTDCHRQRLMIVVHPDPGHLSLNGLPKMLNLASVQKLQRRSENLDIADLITACRSR